MLAIWAAAAAAAADCDEDCRDDLELDPRDDVPERSEMELREYQLDCPALNNPTDGCGSRCGGGSLLLELELGESEGLLLLCLLSLLLLLLLRGGSGLCRRHG